MFDKFPKYHKSILLGDFNTKVGRDEIFKPTIGNESLHEISKDNGVRLVNFATSKNLRVQSTMFPHRNIHKYTWKSPDGKPSSRLTIFWLIGIGILVSSVRSYRAADCDSGHNLVVEKLEGD
jgi:hypothetical protein